MDIKKLIKEELSEIMGYDEDAGYPKSWETQRPKETKYKMEIIFSIEKKLTSTGEEMAIRLLEGSEIMDEDFPGYIDSVKITKI